MKSHIFQELQMLNWNSAGTQWTPPFCILAPYNQPEGAQLWSRGPPGTLQITTCPTPPLSQEMDSTTPISQGLRFDFLNAFCCLTEDAKGEKEQEAGDL